MGTLPNDLEVIEQIGEAIGKEMKELKTIDFHRRSISYWKTQRGYLIESDRVVGLKIVHTSTPPTSLLEKLDSLRMMYLWGVSLSDIEFLKKLKGLTQLNLGNNQITDAGISHIKELKGLTKLYLSSNQITDAGFLKDMDSLQYVDLDGNPIKEPPAEIVAGGISRIREYFKSLEGEKQLLKYK